LESALAAEWAKEVFCAPLSILDVRCIILLPANWATGIFDVYKKVQEIMNTSFLSLQQTPLHHHQFTVPSTVRHSAQHQLLPAKFCLQHQEPCGQCSSSLSNAGSYINKTQAHRKNPKESAFEGFVRGFKYFRPFTPANIAEWSSFWFGLF
jgi:hypothetical protein